MQISDSTSDLSARAAVARIAVDVWVREVVDWHFDPETGCPFWLEYASKLGWDPREKIEGFDDLKRLGPFEDEWLRGGPIRGVDFTVHRGEILGLAGLVASFFSIIYGYSRLVFALSRAGSKPSRIPPVKASSHHSPEYDNLVSPA